MAEVNKYVTSIGFEVEIDSELLDDWELLEMLREVDKGSSGAIVDVAPILLGEEQFSALKDYLKEKTGKIKATDMISVLAEVMDEVKEIKNS